MRTEFEKDIIELAEIICSKDNSKFRKKLLSMFDKMQMSNTKQFYKEAINRVCEQLTGHSYEYLFIGGLENA